MKELTRLTISEALDSLGRGDFSAKELTQAHLDAMEKHRDLNAFITETPDKALDMAAASDQRRAKGEAGVMEGIPIAMKDLFCTQGVKTTAASRILGNFTPQYESTVSGNLWREGAVMLGKANLDEFAMGSANVNSYFGAVKNPWKRKGDKVDLVPGGSSGGSSAAVAARLAMAATGSDTGGSVRQPASYTATVGLKPTYGRCSRWGMIAFASSLDQAGLITRSVRDAAIMLEAMAGYDAKDSTSVNKAVPRYQDALTGDIRDLKIGIPCEYQVEGLTAETQKNWDQGKAWLQAAGAEIVDISLPHSQYALAAYYIIAPAECSSNLARYDGVRYGLRVEGGSLDQMYENTRGEGFGDEVQRRILVGTYVLSAGYYDAYYNKARKARTLIAEDFRKAYEAVDVILTPTTPTAAFAIGENQDDPISMYLSDIFTVPASLAGVPGISVPSGRSSEGLPLGLQLIGRPFDEETLLKVAEVMEKAAAFTALPQLIAGE